MDTPRESPRYIPVPVEICERPYKLSSNALRVYLWVRAEGMRRQSWRKRKAYLFTVEFRIVRNRVGLSAPQIISACGELKRRGLLDYDVGFAPHRLTAQVWREPMQVEVEEREHEASHAPLNEVEAIIKAWNRRTFVRRVRMIRTPVAVALNNAYEWMRDRGSIEPCEEIIKAIAKYQSLPPASRLAIMQEYDCKTERASLQWFLDSRAFASFTKRGGKR